MNRARGLRGRVQVYPFQYGREAARRGSVLRSTAERQQIVDLQRLCPELLREG